MFRSHGAPTELENYFERTPIPIAPPSGAAVDLTDLPLSVHFFISWEGFGLRRGRAKKYPHHAISSTACTSLLMPASASVMREASM